MNKPGLERRGEECLEIIVSGSKQEQGLVFTSGGGGNGYYDPLASALPALEHLQQHSIESSVVTEGHYDASFETEDFPTGDSFDVGPEEGGKSNGHYRGGQRGNGGPSKPLRSMDIIHTNGNGHEDKTKPELALTDLTGAHPNSLKIQSIPSEVELVREGDSSRRSSEMSLPPPSRGNMMLWKRVRHCVVFGVKKKEKE